MPSINLKQSGWFWTFPCKHNDIRTFLLHQVVIVTRQHTHQHTPSRYMAQTQCIMNSLNIHLSIHTDLHVLWLSAFALLPSDSASLSPSSFPTTSAVGYTPYLIVCSVFAIFWSALDSARGAAVTVRHGAAAGERILAAACSGPRFGGLGDVFVRVSVRNAKVYFMIPLLKSHVSHGEQERPNFEETSWARNSKQKLSMFHE
jgi:hypothetical protein